MTKKILIVEDDDVLVKILEKIIESIGYESVWEYTLDDAIDAFRESPPDLVLLDLNLGNEKGHRLLEFRENDPTFQQIPVIVLSSSRARIDVVLAKSRGAADYVVKPFNGRELIQRIQKVL